MLRPQSHSHASCTGRCNRVVGAPCRARPRRLRVCGALFEPPPFEPQKLSVQYLAGARATTSFPPPSRRYTLTHNDITGALQLSIGSDYNQLQVQGFYTRILRDEITAEWYFAAGASAPAELHIYCHVSGEEKWLAPPQLRNFIFRREMTLVLDTFAYADGEFLQLYPELQQAKVYVHFQSDVQDLDLREYWGTLGDRSSWRRMPRGVLARFKLLLFGFPAVPHQRPRSSLTAQQRRQQQQQQPQPQQETGVSGTPALFPAVAAAAGTAEAPVPALQQQLLPQLSLLQQQQQQQHWQPQAAAAIEATRPVALSLQQEQLRLHPPAATASEQPAPGSTSSCNGSSSSSSSSSSIDNGKLPVGSSSSSRNGNANGTSRQQDQLQQQPVDVNTAAAAAAPPPPCEPSAAPTADNACSVLASVQVEAIFDQLHQQDAGGLEECGQWIVLAQQRRQQQQQQRGLGSRPLAIVAGVAVDSRQ